MKITNNSNNCTFLNLLRRNFMIYSESISINNIFFNYYSNVKIVEKLEKELKYLPIINDPNELEYTNKCSNKHDKNNLFCIKCSFEFKLVKKNNTNDIIDIKVSDIFSNGIKFYDQDFIILNLAPNDEIDIMGFAIRGCGTHFKKITLEDYDIESKTIEVNRFLDCEKIIKNTLEIMLKKIKKLQIIN